MCGEGYWHAFLGELSSERIHLVGAQVQMAMGGLVVASRVASLNVGLVLTLGLTSLANRINASEWKFKERCLKRCPQHVKSLN